MTNRGTAIHQFMTVTNTEEEIVKTATTGGRLGNHITGRSAGANGREPAARKAEVSGDQLKRNTTSVYKRDH